MAIPELLDRIKNQLLWNENELNGTFYHLSHCGRIQNKYLLCMYNNKMGVKRAYDYKSKYCVVKTFVVLFSLL